MQRMAVMMLLAATATGCCCQHAQSFNPFVPSGATRVPPPATGACGTPPTYYAPPQSPTVTPPVGTGFQPTPANNHWSNQTVTSSTSIAGRGATPSTSSSATETSVIPAQAVGAALASYQTSASPASTSAATDSGDSSPPRLRGMPVNDATSRTPPQTFVPSGTVMDISQFPAPPPAVRVPGASTSSAGATATSPPANSDMTWQTRPIGS